MPRRKPRFAPGQQVWYEPQSDDYGWQGRISAIVVQQHAHWVTLRFRDRGGQGKEIERRVSPWSLTSAEPTGQLALLPIVEV